MDSDKSSSNAENSTVSDDANSDNSNVYGTAKRTALDDSDVSSDDSDTTSDGSDSSSDKSSVHVTSKKRKRVCMTVKNRRLKLKRQNRIRRLRKAKKAKSTLRNLNAKRQYGDFSNMVRNPSYNTIRIPYHSNEGLFSQLSSYHA
jgi:hypothetical protein